MSSEHEISALVAWYFSKWPSGVFSSASMLRAFCGIVRGTPGGGDVEGCAMLLELEYHITILKVFKK